MSEDGSDFKDEAVEELEQSLLRQVSETVEEAVEPLKDDLEDLERKIEDTANEFKSFREAATPSLDKSLQRSQRIEESLTGLADVIGAGFSELQQSFECLKAQMAMMKDMYSLTQRIDKNLSRIDLQPLSDKVGDVWAELRQSFSDVKDSLQRLNQSVTGVGQETTSLAKRFQQHKNGFDKIQTDFAELSKKTYATTFATLALLSVVMVLFGLAALVPLVLR